MRAISAAIITVTATVLLLGPVREGAADAAGSAATEASLLQAEDALFAAEVSHDVATIDRGFADEAVFVHASGDIQTKPDYLRDAAKARFQISAIETANRVARIYGTVGVVRGTKTVVAGDRRVSGSYLSVYVLRGGRWQLLDQQSSPAPPAANACAKLMQLQLPHTVITEAAIVPKGTFTLPPGGIGGPGAAAAIARLPAFCRVLATLRPTADSDIKIEGWLPADGWNGRLEAVGNGAFMSSIFYGNLADAVAEGYAGVATNTGHEGNSGEFAYGHPEKLIDWGYRAVHEMTVTAKAVIAAYYGNPPRYSYWNSCSTGGREGLMEAENYPEDFDGLAVGDAANPMTRNQASTIFSTLAVNRDPAGFLTEAKWKLYREAVLARCDAADGVKDGLLNNPPGCRYDPHELECRSGDHDDCLTAAQVVSLKTVLAGMKNPRTGEQLHPGWPVGATPNSTMVVGHEPEQVAIDTFRAVFQNPAWDYHSMDFDRDIALSDRLGNPLINAADESRLKALFARGGKLFLYHGWNDPNISPLLAIDYYNKAIAANGGTAGTFDSMRLFMVPGMNHCGGGEGPNVFDKMAVLTRWVEQGTAPERILASHTDAQGQVDRTRPLCPYPQVARYRGSGSTDDAANFACAAP